MPKFTIDQVLKLYELEPWQRELLEEMLRQDEYGWRQRESYRDRAQSMFDEVQQRLDEIIRGRDVRSFEPAIANPIPDDRLAPKPWRP